MHGGRPPVSGQGPSPGPSAVLQPRAPTGTAKHTPRSASHNARSAPRAPQRYDGVSLTAHNYTLSAPPPPAPAPTKTLTQTSKNQSPSEKLFVIRPYIGISSLHQDLQAADERVLEFAPNPSNDLGLTLGYKGLRASASIAVSRVEDTRTHGRSSNFSLDLAYPFKVFERDLVVNGYIYRHKDLLATYPLESENTDAIGGRLLQTEALAGHVGLELQYHFNKAFSYDKSISDFAPRTGTTSSWVVLMGASYSTLGFKENGPRGGERLIPGGARYIAGPLADASRIYGINATVGGGYVLDWNIFGQVFFTARLLVGLGGNLGAVRAAEDTGGAVTRYEGVGFNSAATFGLGYAGNAVQFGMLADAGQRGGDYTETEFRSTRVNVKLYAGIRF